MFEQKQNSLPVNDFFTNDQSRLTEKPEDLIINEEQKFNADFKDNYATDDFWMPEVKKEEPIKKNIEKPDEVVGGKSVFLSGTKILLIKQIVQATIDNLTKINKILNTDEVNKKLDDFSQIGEILMEAKAKLLDQKEINFIEEENKERIIEGVFNGENMIGQDGKEYTVPQNYASKSKLVEGDILKLTINERGNFLFKQIGPIDRQRIIAKLVFDREKNQYYATLEDKNWRLLNASVTFFHGQVGDDAVILVPKNSFSKWAAVENIIKKTFDF